ncbi:MAG: family 20 glycosylhydrolase, partial [Planctomycetes bacterium]|nr:family 20 glycosylhydrolase [Planctomycetota bacterium]
MRHGLFSFVLAFVLCFPSFGRENVQTVKSLRLIPYPKQVIKSSGEFRLDRPLRLQAPEAVIRVVAAWIGEELKGAGFGRPISRGNPTRSQQKADVIFLSPLGRTLEPTALAMPAAAGLRSFRQGATEEDYRLCVQPDGVLIAAKGPAGLLHGAATLCQLIRANRRGAAIPCLQIDDWPSLRWRAFQDDLTRGPSTRLEQLKRDVARGALLKLNIFTYYMEYQFAYSRHPKIGPPDGSLTPQELAALVRHAQPLGVHILGNQQSFAHMHHILAMEEYAHLREDERTLSPVKEETYRFLDDLYADVLPLLPFEFFNVCCDETWGLGTKGPSQELAERIGPGGVYVRHLLRVHELVHGKYGKRMMMWGDIILKHPDKLRLIPKDVIMLTWGYAPRESFEDQIVPFAKSGFEFFVCPGVSNWRRVLPHFRNSVVNIQNFVRDGAKHGALGMLNTSWDDDGENLNAPNWYGFAWGAECAWNASNTPVEEFNRRVGAVLFGEPGDHFGRAIE